MFELDDNVVAFSFGGDFPSFFFLVSVGAELASLVFVALESGTASFLAFVEVGVVGDVEFVFLRPSHHLDIWGQHRPGRYRKIVVPLKPILVAQERYVLR